MLIGELALLSGFSRDTIRYYEKLGLLGRAHKSVNGYKNNTTDAVSRLSQIEELKNMGFTLKEIRNMFAQFSKSSCADLPQLLGRKINKVDEQIRQRMKYKTVLESSQQNCSSDCSFQNNMPSCLPQNCRGF